MSLSPENPFAEVSSLPFRLPDFAAITPQVYREAFEAGMEEELANLAAVASNPEPATVENVLEAAEVAGRVLDRAQLAFGAQWAADSTPELDELLAEFSPRFSAHADAIMLDRRLFDRFTELATRAEAGEVELTPQDAWLLGETLRSFTRAGVALDAAAQDRLRELNARLADLQTTFQRANRDARVGGAVVVADRAELAGLSDEEIDGLATDEGTWRIELVNTSQQPIVAKLHNRSLRQRILEASLGRGLGGEHDVRQVIVDIARTRAERATLLGYENHAALTAEANCARTPEAINQLMGPIGRAAAAQAARDAEAFAARFAQIEPDATFAAWDWEYVADLVRAETYGFSDADVAPFLDVEKVLDAVYTAAHDLYGITFTPRPDLRGHTADAEVFEVSDADGTPVGLFVMDFWARPGKQGGAWMNSLVRQGHLTRDLPVVTNNCNYTRGSSAISWDGVITMFHEFGHALHGLFADSQYPSRAGTAVPRDFVEFPSQVNEHWAWQPGRVLPATWLEKLAASQSFNQGFHALEIMAATLLDQAWHQTPLESLPTSGEEVEAFEARALEAWGVASDLVPPRYRSTYFNHIWGSGYAAGYYGYKWAEVMDADAVAWFTENGGGTPENGDHFRRTLLAPGGSVDAMETWRTFRGREPQVEPLLERMGLEL